MSEPPPYTKNSSVHPQPEVDTQGPPGAVHPQPQVNTQGPPVYPHPVYQNQYQQQPVMHQPAQHSSNTTVVVMGQPQPQQQMFRNWTTGICGCFEDPMVCLCVMCCPECYACHLASKAGETCCLPCCVPGWLISLRAHTRGKHNIAGSICDDCCMAACCYQCTICQLSRELDNINKGMVPR